MKSEKITKNRIGARRDAKKRWYDDACGTAFALEMIGERWAILIMRELMFGPRRFSELRADLPGISANVLTQRLEGLEARAILRRRMLAAPVNAPVYELTGWGMEAESLVQMLGSWATRHPDHDPTLPLSAASLMMSFKTMFDARRAGAFAARLGFQLGPQQFLVTIGGGRLEADRAEIDPAEADVIVTGEPTAIAGVIYGGVPLADALGEGIVALDGDRGAFERFTGLFPLPDKIDIGASI